MVREESYKATVDNTAWIQTQYLQNAKIFLQLLYIVFGTL
jgi:hypothetical protein